MQITDYAQQIDDIEGTLTIYTEGDTKIGGPLQDLVDKPGSNIEIVKCL